jgi:hypothetical protein
MEQLPTKEQILENHSAISYAKGTGILEAMEEYAAVRKAVALYEIEKAHKLYREIEGDNKAANYLLNTAREVLSGQQPEMSEFEKVIASVVENRGKEPDSDVLEKAQREQPAQQPAFGWIPLKEYYLENGQDYLLLYDDGSVSRRDEEDQPFAVVTHYMPIPPPPKAGEQPLKSEG